MDNLLQKYTTGLGTSNVQVGDRENLGTDFAGEPELLQLFLEETIFGQKLFDETWKPTIYAVKNLLFKEERSKEVLGHGPAL